MTEITLTELLAEREDRARRQRELIDRHCSPIISFTMNIAGPIKTSPKICRAHREGVRALSRALSRFHINESTTEYGKCGPVSLYSVDADAHELKSICVEIEETSPLGRLFDMDVTAPTGEKLSRTGERGCIVCGRPGRVCAAGRLHSVDELRRVTDRIITDGLLSSYSAILAELARESLLCEVYTAPKPGLVDPESTGSHRDMDVNTFERSADAIAPYFKECVLIGAKTHTLPPIDTFDALRRAGISSEADMYSATGGVNTHKGIIYSMGIILGAIGRLMMPDFSIPTLSAISRECARIAGESARADLEQIGSATAGGRMYRERGKGGVRAEAASGFSSLMSISLPVFRRAIASGKTKNDAGVTALLHLIANIYDSSIYNRGGSRGIEYAMSRARELISDGAPSMADVHALDREFTERNLSPGGCADLLAITYFLDSLEDTARELESTPD